MRASTASLIRILLLPLVAGAASAAVQDGAQQRCLVGFQKGAGRVAKAAGQSALLCVRDAARGAADAGPCIEGELPGKIARAEAKLEAVELGRCSSSPAEFGVADAESAAAAARGGRDALVDDLLGADVEVASERGAARCQVAVLGLAGKLVDAHWWAAVGAGRKAVADGADSASA